ncbi:MAG TPA: CoA transferase, partial [Thermoanaerobaculia bacterium]|nr:CoA transferase [Thermoanaerobaculia bacterium]
TDRHFQLLCDEVLGLGELAREVRFATNAARVKNRARLIPLLESKFRTRRAAHWVTRCRRAGVPSALVQGVREALRSPAGRLLVTEVDHPEIGGYAAVGSPLLISGGRLPVRLAPPALGQHTAGVLGELGLGRAALAALRRDGVI